MKKINRKLSALSLFYPVYNEAGNIAEAINQALSILPKITNKFEIIVVDDGSTDSTYQIAKRLSKKHRQIKVVTQSNLGYGGALKRGFSEAKYPWIFFTDGDLQFDLNEIEHLIKHASKYDMVLGYRKKRVEGFKRILLAKALKLWATILLGFPTQIKDIDCAFKLIHRNVIQDISPLFSNGAIISTELILKAIKRGFTYHQVGVSHFSRSTGTSTGSNIKVIAKAIHDTLLLQHTLLKEFLQKQTNFVLTSKT